MADITIEDWAGFPYSDEEWSRIADVIGEVDDLTKAQIGTIAGVVGSMQAFDKASPEPKKAVDRMLKLSGRVDAIERELRDIWVEEEIAYGLGGDDAFEEIARLRETLRRLSVAARERAGRQSTGRTRNPRGDCVKFRDGALAGWANIYEATRGPARTQWNEYEGRREGGIIDFLLACAEPVFGRFEKIPVTRDAIAGFLKERRGNHRPTILVGVVDEE